jgi:hypothetical protein
LKDRREFKKKGTKGRREGAKKVFFGKGKKDEKKSSFTEEGNN